MWVTSTRLVPGGGAAVSSARASGAEPRTRRSSVVSARPHARSAVSRVRHIGLASTCPTGTPSALAARPSAVACSAPWVLVVLANLPANEPVRRYAARLLGYS